MAGGGSVSDIENDVVDAIAAMEEALRLLDRAGASTASAHLSLVIDLATDTLAEVRGGQSLKH